MNIVTYKFDSSLFNSRVTIFTLPRFSIVWPIVTINMITPFDVNTQLKLGTVETDDRFANIDLTSLDISKSVFATGGNPAFITKRELVIMKILGATTPTRGSGWLITSWINLEGK